MTTHEQQMQRYVQQYADFEHVHDSPNDLLNSEIAELHRKIKVLTEDISETERPIALLS